MDENGNKIKIGFSRNSGLAKAKHKRIISVITALKGGAIAKGRAIELMSG